MSDTIVDEFPQTITTSSVTVSGARASRSSSMIDGPSTGAGDEDEVSNSLRAPPTIISIGGSNVVISREAISDDSSDTSSDDYAGIYTCTSIYIYIYSFHHIYMWLVGFL